MTGSEIPSQDRRALKSVISLGRFVIAGLACLALLIGGVGWARFERSGLVLSGVTALGVPLGGSSLEMAERKISERAQSLAREKLRVVLAGRESSVAIAALGVVVDARATAARAMDVARASGRWRNGWRFLRSYASTEELEAVTTFDQLKLAAVLEQLESALIEDRPYSGGIAFEGSRPRAVPARKGRRLMPEATRTLLARAVRRGSSTEPLLLSAETVAPRLAEGTLARSLAIAERICAGPVVLNAGARQLVAEPLELAGLVSTAVRDGELSVELSPARLEAWLAGKRAALEAPPKDATFAVSAKDELSIVPSEPGVRLHAEDVGQALLLAAARIERTHELPLRREPEPLRTTSLAERLGLRRLVGSFTTRHPCCQGRVENIHRIAALMDGLLVEPGQTVSVNAVVGPRTRKNGFVAAPSIEDGEMVDTVGGGVSQFATTFFNAIFHAGYDIIERQPHSYWFPRYPMGHEATLSWPKPDIVFKNDSDAGLLIKTSVSKTSVTVKLYGDTGARKVHSEVSSRRDIVKPSVEWLPNRELEPDEEKVVDGGMIGWSVVASRRVSFADGTKKEERRKVTYKPKPRRVELHPCRIPEGEPGATGEACPEPEQPEAPGEEPERDVETERPAQAH